MQLRLEHACQQVEAVYSLEGETRARRLYRLGYFGLNGPTPVELRHPTILFLSQLSPLSHSLTLAEQVLWALLKDHLGIESMAENMSPLLLKARPTVVELSKWGEC